MSTTKSHQGTITCDRCGEECDTFSIDIGIGSYEYGGAIGFDRQEVQLSRCCEANYTYHEDNETIEPYVLAPDNDPPF